MTCIEPRKSVKVSSMSDFKMVKKLGEGKFGSVSMVIHGQSGCLFAIKKIKKEVIRAHMMVEQLGV